MPPKNFTGRIIPPAAPARHRYTTYLYGPQDIGIVQFASGEVKFPPEGRGDAMGQGGLVVNPPLLLDGVEEELLHGLEVVVVVVPAVVDRLLLGDHKGQVRDVLRHVAAVAAGEPEDGVTIVPQLLFPWPPVGRVGQVLCTSA